MLCVQCAADLLNSDPKPSGSEAPGADPPPAFRQNGTPATGSDSPMPGQQAPQRESRKRPLADARRNAGSHSSTARRPPAGRKRVTFADAAALQEPDLLHAPGRSTPAVAQEVLVPDTCEAPGMLRHSAKSGSQQGTKQDDGPSTAAPGAAGRMGALSRETTSKEAVTEEGAKPSPEWLLETQQPAVPVRPFARAKHQRAAEASANEEPTPVPHSDKAKQVPPAEAGPGSQKGQAARRGASCRKRAGAEGWPGSSAPQPASTEEGSAAAEPVRAGSSRRAEKQGAGRSSRSKRPCRQGRSRTAADRSFIQQFTAEAGGLPGCGLGKSPEAVEECQQEAGKPLDAEKALGIQQPSAITAAPAETEQAMPKDDGQPGARPDDTLHPSQSRPPTGEQLHH